MSSQVMATGPEYNQSMQVRRGVLEVEWEGNHHIVIFIHNN